MPTTCGSCRNCQQPDFLSRQRDFLAKPAAAVSGAVHSARRTRRRAFCRKIPVGMSCNSPLELRAPHCRIADGSRGISFLDLVLFGLCRGYAQWSLGQPLYLDMEHHGRSGILDRIDLARTLGPTTVKVPVRLPAVLPSADLDAGDHPDRAQNYDEARHRLWLLRYCRPDRHGR